jgi:hypothetical protein
MTLSLTLSRFLSLSPFPNTRKLTTAGDDVHVLCDDGDGPKISVSDRRRTRESDEERRTINRSLDLFFSSSFLLRPLTLTLNLSSTSLLRPLSPDRQHLPVPHPGQLHRQRRRQSHQGGRGDLLLGGSSRGQGRRRRRGQGRLGKAVGRSRGRARRRGGRAGVVVQARGGQGGEEAVPRGEGGVQVAPHGRGARGVAGW